MINPHCSICHGLGCAICEQLGARAITKGELDRLRRGVPNLPAAKQLPECIIAAVEKTYTRCRTVTKDLKTGEHAYGKWFVIERERAVQKAIEKQNDFYWREYRSWIEFQ